MRRPSLVKKYVYKRSTGYPGWVPTNGRRTQICRGQDFLGPLSLITVKSSERNGGVKGAHFVRGLRTLDTVVPFPRMKGKGKGAGGLRGLAPWRSMRQRLMRAPRARRPSTTSPTLISPIVAFPPPRGWRSCQPIQAVAFVGFRLASIRST